MADDAQYLVQRPQGQDGPFSREDLVRLAELGRLQPDDRILDAATCAATTAGELLPGLVRSGSEARVRRRSTSDRLSAQSGAPSPHRMRTPLPGQPAPVESAPAVRRPPAAWSVALVAVAAVFLAAVAVRHFVRPAVPPPPLLHVGIWQTLVGEGRTDVWRIVVSGDAVSIVAPDGQLHASPVALVASDDQRCVLELASPHPLLGARLVLTGVAVGCALGELPAEHVPPL